MHNKKVPSEPNKDWRNEANDEIVRISESELLTIASEFHSVSPDDVTDMQLLHAQERYLASHPGAIIEKGPRINAFNLAFSEDIKTGTEKGKALCAADQERAARIKREVRGAWEYTKKHCKHPEAWEEFLAVLEKADISDRLQLIGSLEKGWSPSNPAQSELPDWRYLQSLSSPWGVHLGCPPFINSSDFFFHCLFAFLGEQSSPDITGTTRPGAGVIRRPLRASTELLKQLVSWARTHEIEARSYGDLSIAYPPPETFEETDSLYRAAKTRFTTSCDEGLGTILRKHETDIRRADGVSTLRELGTKMLELTGDYLKSFGQELESAYGTQIEAGLDPARAYELRSITRLRYKAALAFDVTGRWSDDSGDLLSRVRSNQFVSRSLRAESLEYEVLKTAEDQITALRKRVFDEQYFVPSDIRTWFGQHHESLAYFDPEPDSADVSDDASSDDQALKDLAVRADLNELEIVKAGFERLQSKEESLPEKSRLKIAGSDYYGNPPNRAEFEELATKFGVATGCAPMLDRSLHHLRIYLALVDSDILFPRGNRDGLIYHPAAGFAKFCSHLIVFVLQFRYERASAAASLLDKEADQDIKTTNTDMVTLPHPVAPEPDLRDPSLQDKVEQQTSRSAPQDAGHHGAAASVRKTRGRPAHISDELKERALAAEGGKARAQILYDTKYPSVQQVKNVPAILRNYRKRHGEKQG